MSEILGCDAMNFKLALQREQRDISKPELMMLTERHLISHTRAAMNDASWSQVTTSGDHTLRLATHATKAAALGAQRRSGGKRRSSSEAERENTTTKEHQKHNN